jgi:hypothetical protein
MLAPSGAIRLRVLLRMPQLPALLEVRIASLGVTSVPVMTRVLITGLAASAPVCWTGDTEFNDLPAGSHRVSLWLSGTPVDGVVIAVRGRKAPQSLRVMLGSCYGGKLRAGSTLRAMVDRMRGSDPESNAPRPLALTLLMGDQVYLDLPLSLGRSDSQLIADLYYKYLRQWFDDDEFAALLQAAPVVMIADDHELWNNAPAPQAHIPDTWTKRQREVWLQLGRQLFDTFQQIPALADEPSRSRYLREPPLFALFMDARMMRGEDRNTLFDAGGVQSLDRWAADLAVAPTGSIGLLGIGQPPLEPEVGRFKAKWVDASLANFGADYEHVLDRLSNVPHPVIVLTGDVHFGRALGMRAMLGRTQGPLIEVVCSPLALINSGKAEKPTYEVNDRPLKKCGYQRDSARIGLGSASMLGVLSLEFLGKTKAHMNWLHVPAATGQPQLQRAELLPELRSL